MSRLFRDVEGGLLCPQGSVVCIGAFDGLHLGHRALVRHAVSRARAHDVRPMHEALALSTLAAIALHGLLLLGDTWLKPTLEQIAVPFAASFSPASTAVGILSGYALAALSLSYYARARIGVARWRARHRFTIVPWVGGLVHALGIGSDAGTTWFLALIGLTTAPTLVLLAHRRAVDASAARH